MLSNIISEDHPLKEFWIRSLTFSARGIDSIGSVGSTSNFAESNLRSIEYKLIFDINDKFNHPLNITDYIVAWQINPPFSDNQIIKDEFNLYGYISSYKTYPLSLAGQITDIRSENDDAYNNTVVVICLKELIKQTFNVTYNKL